MFELMRDEVIAGLLMGSKREIDGRVLRSWRCVVHLPDLEWSKAPPEEHIFESKISALDAYMQALGFITMQAAAGKEIYKHDVRVRRSKLGL